MDNKRYLDAYLDMLRDIKILERKCLCLRDALKKSTPSYSDEPIAKTGYKESRIEAKTIDLVVAESELDELKQKAERQRSVIFRAIGKLDSFYFRQVVELRYLNAASIGNIAEVMQYSDRHIKRLLKAAICRLELTEVDNDQ